MSGQRPEPRERRRILYLELSRDGTVGGSHHSLLNNVRAVRSDRFEPLTCFYEDNYVAELLRSEGLDAHIVQPAGPRSAPAGGEGLLGKSLGRVQTAWRTGIDAPLRFRSYLREWKVDLLHQNNSVGLGAEWTLAARSLNIPVVIHQRGYYFGGRLNRMVTDGRIGRVVCISRSVQRALHRSTRVPEDRVRLIWNFLDTSRFRPRELADRRRVRAEFGVGPDQLFCGMVGNLREWKGQHVVLEALALLPARLRQRIRCAFLGAVSSRDEERTYADRLKARAAEPELAPMVLFCDFREKLEEIYPAMDLLIHASITPEPFGRVLAESMSCGVPVVATRGGGPEDIVEEGISGLLVERGNPSAMAAAVEQLVGSPGRLEEMGREARKRAVSMFSREVAVPRLTGLYDELLAAEG